MKHRLSSLTLVSVIAFAIVKTGISQSSTETPAPAEAQHSDSAFAPESQRMLEMASKQLADVKSVSAKVRHTTSVYDQQLVGSGNYLQLRHPDGLKVRLDLFIRTEDYVTSYQHVCNGRFLYTLENLGETARLGKVDLNRVRDVLKQRRDTAPAFPTLDMIASGGIPRILDALAQHFQFSEPQSVTFEQVPMWALAGQWNAESLKALLPNLPKVVSPQGRVVADELPPQFPDRVFVLLGKDDLFPYRIEYRRANDRSSDAAETAQPQNRAMLAMDFYQVQFGEDIDPLRFAFNPGQVKPEDRTEQMLGRLIRSATTLQAQTADEPMRR